MDSTGEETASASAVTDDTNNDRLPPGHGCPHDQVRGVSHEVSPNTKTTNRVAAPPPPPSSAVKVIVFVGIFLLRMLDGVPWVWGNLNVYVISYYYAKGDDSSGDSTNWLLSIDSIGFNFGLLLGGLIARKIGIRLTLLLGVLGFNGGLIFSYFTVQHSAIALSSTLGAITGLSGGIVENCQLTLIVRWTDRYKGLAASSVPSMNILGAVVINLILTLFINPSNAETDDERDNIKIFTQEDLINRVPYSFLLYGFLSLTINMMGFLMIRIHREDDNIFYEMFEKCKKLLAYSKGKRDDEEEEENVHFNKESIITRYESLHNEEDDVSRPSLQHDTGAIVTTLTNNTSTRSQGEEGEFDDSKFHFTPKQALKTRAFYVMWLFSSVLTYGFFTLNTYYKAFGLRYIPDDYFLTAVVMVKCLVTPICTWIAGFCVDKLGVKPTMVSISSMFCVVASLYYLTVVNRWLYMVATVLYGCALFSLFCVMSACCVKLYGQTHFSTIFGLIQSLSNVATLTIPPLTRWILSAHGWAALFLSVGGLSFCQVVLLIVGLPYRRYYFRKEDERVD